MDNIDNNRLWTLLARKTANEITPEEETELSDLLQKHPFALYTQEILTEEWQDSYKSISDKDTEKAFAKHISRLSEASEPKKRTIPIWRYVAALAAAAIVLLGIWRFSGPDAPTNNQIATNQNVETEKGKRSRLTLPDGTKVWLNAETKLLYPDQFEGATREVTLEGEAFFDVVRNEKRPFLVHTKNFTVKVVGTSFNIRAYNDEERAEASLINGSVEVQLKDSKPVVLKPSEKLLIPTPLTENLSDRSTEKDTKNVTEPITVRKTSVTDIQDKEVTIISETAWVSDKLAFKNMSFPRIALSLEKWFGVRIQFREEDKKKLHLTGTFKNESLDEILKAFKLTGKSFDYQRDADGTIWIY